MTNRDMVVRAEVSAEEKQKWEQYLSKVGPETTHREGMLAAAEAAEYLQQEFPDLFEEAFESV